MSETATENYMKTLRLIMAVTGLFTFTMCNKYDEGPMLSLRSKTERVANNWKVAQAIEDGKDVTGDYNKYELDLTKTGNARLSAEYKFVRVSYKFETDGTWSFVNDKENISFNYKNDDADAVYRILKLHEDEMWLRKDGTTLEFHLVPR